MTARPDNLISRRWVGLFVCILSLSAGLWIGCSTPQEKYRTLSFFFDGVPNPDAPKHVAQTQDTKEGLVFVAAVRSRHKPYIERKCDACHRSASGNIMEFDEAWKSCLNCHSKIPTEHALMHGPVAAAGFKGAQPTCRWCHTPHESRELSLLNDNPVKVCTQCHDAQLLGPKPQQHLDGTSCVQCHFGHGADLKNSHFLKPGGMQERPATRPDAASQPASQPATTPASRPADQFAHSGAIP
ncbi:MAG TPA: cytochrome c3 family protein [Phycisphaerae bacterium]|nr:cytochrome c3 family protein [Phycisphaerae bacterium]